MAFLSAPVLPSSSTSSRASVRSVSMKSDQPVRVSRRALLSGAVAAVAAMAVLPNSVLADREYANVGFLGGSKIIDINNANVRAYQKLRGFYPTLAGLIVTNGPYEAVDDLYKLPGITTAMKEALNTYKEQLVALKPAPEYVIDKINNGLYR